MKKIFFLMIAAFSVLAVATMSCSDGKTSVKQTGNRIGKLKLKVSSDGKDYVDVVSKAEPAVNTGDFKVVIKDADGVTVNSWDRFSDMDEIIGLKIGSYTVEAVSGDMVSAGWDAPHYAGSQSFFVAPDEIAAVNLVCGLDNAKISVTYTEEFKAFFQGDFQIKLVNEDYTTENTPITFTADETRSAYVKPARFELQFTSSKAPNNITVVETVKPKDHHLVTFGVKPVGDAMINMTVDVTMNDVNMDLEVPTDEEDLGNGGNMPDPGGDPDPGPTPDGTVAITGQGFDIAQPYVISDATDFDEQNNCKKPVQVLLSASKGIDQLWVEIDSPDLSEDLLNAAIGAKRFDIANAPDNIRANLIMFQVIKESDVIKGATSFVFDVTGFMSLLPVNSVNHNFHITLTDSDGKSESATLAISRTE